VEVLIYNGHPYSGGQVVRDLHGPTSYYSDGEPPYPYAWDGKINGSIAPNGTYYYLIKAYKDIDFPYGDEAYGSFSVNSGGGNGGGTAPVIGTTSHYDSTSYDYASPNPFYPDQNETTTVHYSLNVNDANVSVEFSKNGQLVETISGTSTQAVWDGKSGSTPFSEGFYTYKIVATNNYGSDYEYGSVEIEHQGQQGTAPVIGTTSHYDSTSYDYATPNPFIPDQGETTTVHYSLNVNDASVTVEFSKDGQLVETVNGTSSQATWDGKMGSTPYEEGVYTYKIIATNNYGTDYEYGSVELKDYEPQGTAPVIGTTDHYDSTNYDWASPNPFDPHDNETTTIHYELNTNVNSVNVEIMYNGNVVETVTGTTSSGSNTAVWDGKNGSTPFSDGVYTYKITATNNDGSDYEYGSVTIEHGTSGTAPIIGTTDHYDSTNYDYASPNPFDPDDNETTTVYYSLNTNVDSVNVEFMYNGNVVDTKTGGTSSGTNTAVWDGKDGSTPFDEGLYTYKITATNNYGSDYEYGSVEIDYDGGGQGDGPVIGDHKGNDNDDYADRDPFNPYDYNKTTIRFRLSEDATVRFTLRRGSTEIEEITFSGEEGTNAVEWDGRDSYNDPHPEGTYTYEIYAWNNDGNDTEEGTVVIDYDNGGGGDDDPDITHHNVNPNPFDPDEENTRIYYSIDENAYMTVEIYDEDGDRIRILLDDVWKLDGSHSVSWDGEDKFGDRVDDGDYEYKIIACDNNDNNCDVEWGDVEVDRDASSSDDLIDNIDINNALFDPTEGERVELCFEVQKDNVEVTVEILDGNTVIDTLLDEAEYDEGYERCVRWDGRDDDNDLVDDDVYQFRIFAEKGNERQVEYEWTEVDTDGRIIGFPDDDEYCGGFWDVPQDSPFCRAIELMKYRGIFQGYPDGSFRPYNNINRAETTKVILLALEYDIMNDDGSNLGFWDVERRAWYMEYLRTAQRWGIIHGYPDGSFRPYESVNRVELLKIFLEASDLDIPHCNYSPYPDTPLNSDTRWYMDYACFAKTYGLMSTDSSGNFNPAEPMSRGDVAELFYRFEKRGLFNGYNNNYYGSYWDNYNEDWYWSGSGYWDYDYFY
jgi:flagellar hook assembly protein FlgD